MPCAACVAFPCRAAVGLCPYPSAQRRAPSGRLCRALQPLPPRRSCPTRTTRTATDRFCASPGSRPLLLPRHQDASLLFPVRPALPSPLPLLPVGRHHRDRRQPPRTDEQTHHRDFLRKIRSPRCSSAAGKAWNRTPSLSSFFSLTSRALLL
jgi:hypothetical protein